MSVARQRFVAALLALLLGGAGAAVAQEYRVSAFVRPEKNISDGRPIQLVIQVDGVGALQVRPPALPPLQNLKLAGGPSTNSQHSWINGQASSQYQLLYTLIAEGPGPARIPALDVQVDGKTYRTEPIEFTVQPSAGGPPPQADGPRTAPGEARDEYEVFLRAELGAQDVWVGQPVPLSVTLYTTERISNPSWRATPSFGNFWVEEIQVNPEAEAYRTQIEGRTYMAYPVERKLLIPPSPGQFDIEPYVVQMQVQRSRDGLFGFFGFDRGEAVIRRTEPLRIRVRQLPGDKPDGFGGAVGSYSLRASLDREQTQVNDAVALRATVEGEGFLRAVEPPVFEPPPDVKVFEPKVSESTSEIRGKVVSRKSWEWILVPLAPGDLELPELRFPYFDPGRGEYREARSSPLELVVRRAAAADTPETAHGEIQLQRRDLSFIKPRRGSLLEAQSRAHRQTRFVVLFVLPFVLLPIAVVAGRRRARLQRDLGLARARRAGPRARKRLRAARARLEQSDAASFHEQVARALVEYVADRFDRSAAGLTYEVANDLLVSRNVPLETRRGFRACLETCDFARFVPAAAATERRTELLDQAGALIEELEQAW